MESKLKNNAIKRVLILGDRGFTGRYLIKQLSPHNDLEIFLSSDFDMDLTHKDSLVDFFNNHTVDVVVNLAAKSHIQDDVSEIYDVNAFGVLNLLEVLAVQDQTPHFIQASSANIYGNKTTSLIHVENPPNPSNHYSVSKVMSESFCGFFEENISSTIVRPFSCIGPGQNPRFLLPKLVRFFKEKDKILELGNINIQRDFVDIRDAVRVYEALILKEPANGAVFHIASGNAVSIKTLIQILSEISNHKDYDVKINPQFIRKNDLEFQVGDNSKTNEMLNVAPKYSIRETLKYMLEN